MILEQWTTIALLQQIPNIKKSNVMEIQMTFYRVKDLYQYLSDIPQNAYVFIRSEYADNMEVLQNYVVSRTPITEKYPDPNSMIWEFENYKYIYDEEELLAYDTSAPITAVLLLSE